MTAPVVADTFVELANTLVTDFDLVDFLHLVTVRSQQALGVDAVGLLLADNHDGLNVVAASGEQARVLELFQLQNAEGPCLDCYRSGQLVSAEDLASESRWPRFVARALEGGFAAVYALPMRLRDEVVGGMNLFTGTHGGLDPGLLAIAQALTDVAAIGLLLQRAVHRRDLVTQQLQTALNGRLAVEQAKGVLAERGGVGVGEALELLRAYAGESGRGLTEVAEAVVRRDPAVANLALRSGIPPNG